MKQHRHLLALLLFLALTLSFLWCIVNNIVLGAQTAQESVVSSATTVAIIGAMLWLAGHGIHGAAIVALPALLLQRLRARDRFHAG